MKKYKKFITSSQGSSLIEILIATLVVGTILTAVATGLTYSVKLGSKAKLRSTATRLAQEGMEIFKRERVIRGWNTFQSDYSDCSSDCSICISSSSFPDPGDGIDPSYFCGIGCDCGPSDFDLDAENLVNNFKRKAIVSSGSDSLGEYVTIQVIVSWSEPNLSSNPNVIVNREFREW